MRLVQGPVGPVLAERLGIPYLGYVAGVTTSGDKAVARKEYPGGVIAEMEMSLPGVLGIQAAEKPPRYVAVSKVRQAMQTTTLESRPLPAPDVTGALPVARMFQPEASQRATMLEGDVDAVAAKLVGVLKEAGVL